MMAGYIWPAKFTGKSTWDAHNRRRPPSSEPGIDLYMPTGTQLVAIADCTVVGLGGGTGPATGRFVTIDDGVRWWRFLHNADWGNLWVGKRLKQGDPLCRSGASGYGSEFFGEPSRNAAFWRNTGGDHVHVTAFRGRGYTFGAGGTVNPEHIIGPALAGIDPKPFQEAEMNDAERAQMARIEAKLDAIPSQVWNAQVGRGDRRRSIATMLAEIAASTSDIPGRVWSAAVGRGENRRTMATMLSMLFGDRTVEKPVEDEPPVVEPADVPAPVEGDASSDVRG